MNTCEMRRAVRKPGIALHGRLQQLVGVQAALHQRQRIARAAHCHGSFRGMSLGFGFDDRKRADVGADLCRQRLHRRFRANERGLNQPGSRRFHRAVHCHFVSGHTTAVVIAGKLLQRSMNL